MRVGELSPAERSALKLALTEDLAVTSNDPVQTALLERGYVRMEADRLVITVLGHLRYLATLPEQFDWAR